MSFQRRVGTANRGAIPYVPLDQPPGRMRVLVPLRGGEALWVAVLARDTVRVEGRAGNRPLHVEKLPAGKNHGVLHMLDAVLDSDRWVQIDTTSIATATNRDAIGDAGMTVILEDSLAAAAQRIEIVLATSSLYSAISGLPAPGPTTARDEYGKWRLP